MKKLIKYPAVFILIACLSFIFSCKKKSNDDAGGCPNCPSVTSISPKEAHGVILLQSLEKTLQPRHWMKL